MNSTMPITHALYERPEIDTVSRPLAPEDIRVGMYLSTLAECQELWPWLITVEDILYDRVKPLRYTERPKCNDDPVIVILDEPNSNLDNDGSMALNQAIRALKANGTSVLIMAHRPAAIQECDMLLVIDDGTRAAFGPKDKVMQDMLSNHQELRQTVAMGGVQ